MRNDFKPGTYLAHGVEWKKHKYVAKVKLSSGKYFYFYDTATYQNYLKKQGNSQGQNAKANPNKDTAEKAMSGNDTRKSLITKGTAGKTTAEKTKNLKNAIATGTKKIQEALSKSSKKSSKSGASSKSKASSIAGKSKGSSGSSSKASKAAGSKAASSSKESKEKSDGNQSNASYQRRN